MKNKLGMELLRTRSGGAWLLPVLFLLAAAVTLKADIFGDYVYTVNPNGTVRIDEYTGLGSAVTVPSVITGRTVVGIGRYAFSACTTLTNVTVPASVSYLEEYVFNECTSLAGVTIGNGVTSIGARIFNNCTNLTAITVDAGNSAFSSSNGVLFNYNQTTLIQYPVGKAGAYTIPNSVASLGEEAFMSSTRLTGVTFGSSVGSIGDLAFWGCTSLVDVAISAGVIRIGNDAFNGCTALAGLTIPAGVTSIGNSAFYECSSLAGVTIPNSVTNIGEGAFIRCINLAAITVDTGNAAYSSLDGVLFNHNQTMLVQCPGGKAGSYTIPFGVTNIGGDAFSTWPAEGLGGFSWCTRLTSIMIPASVTSIGKNAFSFCTSLTGIAIPASVTSIGYLAFRNCSSLAGITIPASITSISYWMLASCTSLTNVTIPDSVTNIGDNAFGGCTNLAGAYFRGNAPNAGLEIFYNAGHATVYYFAGTTGWGPAYCGRPTALWSAPPEPTVKANGALKGININYPGTVSVTVAMNAGGYAGIPVDWWAVALAGSSWYYMDNSGQWTQFDGNIAHCRPVYQGGLFNLPATEVLNIPGLPVGSYTFWFAVDYPMDGILNLDGLNFVDSVNITVR